MSLPLVIWLICTCAPAKALQKLSPSQKTTHLNGFFPSWTNATCVFMWLFRKKLYLVTNVTFELLFYIMNWRSMCIHLPLLRTAVITNFTFEWFLSLMWLFLRGAIFTDITLKCCCFFRMNCTNVFSQTFL